MKSVILPQQYNYVGVFLTFACQLKCSYCINHFRAASPKYKQLSGKDWIRGLNRLELKDDLPISIQGGEPTLHPDFYEIINGIDSNKHIDILTNGMFDVEEFVKKIKPERLKRNSPYASIRFSYHQETMDLSTLIEKVLYLQERGYHVGVWPLDHPRDTKLIHIADSVMKEKGIDSRVKEFLGEYNGKMYGTYLYPKAVDGKRKKCLCKPSEMLIAPDGSIYRCHYELYNHVRAYAHILDAHVKPYDKPVSCETMGLCNPCDIKLKNDRFQVFGHCSVEIVEDKKE